MPGRPEGPRGAAWLAPRRRRLKVAMAAVLPRSRTLGKGQPGDRAGSCRMAARCRRLVSAPSGESGGEWYSVPALTPWAGRSAIGQWRRRVSIGEALTAARHQAGLTITQVSQRTRIRETIVRGIERDDFSACGGDFYARGHIRAIARATGADPEPLVREYDSSH